MTPLERAVERIYSEVTKADRSIDKIEARAIVRTVLLAMREPSDAIIDAMRKTIPVDGHEWEWVPEDAADCWRAMIDAALGDSSDKLT